MLRKRLLTLSHIGVVFMSFNVNFDVVRSAVQIAMWLPGIFLLIRSSLDSSAYSFAVPCSFEIRNPSSTDKESRIHSVQSRIQDYLGLPYKG